MSRAALPGTGRGWESSPTRAGWATHAALVVVQFAFASQTVEAKIAMSPRALGGEGIAPEALAMLRMVGGALFFQALLAVRARFVGPEHRPGALEAPSRRDHLRLAGLSVLGIALNQTLFLLGLRWTSPFAVALLAATIPVFTAGLSIAVRQETFAWRTAFGLALALSGVLWLAGRGSFDPGAVLVSLNSLSYAAYVVLSRDTVRRLGAVQVVAWIFTYGAILFAPFGLRAAIAEVATLGPRGWALVAYVVIVPTIVAYSLNAWALARSSPTLVTVYICLQPLLAAVLARLQLGHTVSERAGVAAVLVLAGLGVVASRRR